MQNEFRNKVAVITGGFRGTGKNISEKFKSLGIKVYCLDIKYPKKIFISKKEINYKIDIADYSEIKQFVSFIIKKEKKIDFLINNAGVSIGFLNNKNILDYWNKTINTNVSSAFFLANGLLNLLKKSKFSSIVNISSIASLIGMRNNQAYNASKGALTALTYSQAVDFSKFKIRSNAISPGYIKTTMTNQSYTNKYKYKIRVNRTMSNKYGTSEDISELVIFLCSKKSKYINAENIILDGGLLKKGI